MSESLTLKQEEIVQFHVSGLTVKEIAERQGVTIKTVYQALAKPIVKARVIELEAEKYRPILLLYQSELLKNVQALAEIRDNKSETGRTRVSAVAEMHSMLFRLLEAVDFKSFQATVEALLPERSET